MPLLAVSMPTPISTPEPERHRGRPSLSEEEHEARRLARNRARREQRRAARAAAEAPPPPILEPLPTPPPVEVAPPAPLHVYFALGQRARALLGFGLGAFVPLASYMEIHFEVAAHPQLWFLVAGALVYSAISVYTWAVEAFHYRLKAVGFVVLLEGTMTFCSIAWLSLAGLAILMILNAVTAAVTLQARKTRPADSPDSGLSFLTR
jgi:hypothetical protein